MKRYYFMLLFFSLCLIVAGCRRGGNGTPRPPVLVNIERDIIPAKNEGERMFAARPKDRKCKVWIDNVYAVDAELQKDSNKANHKKRWADISRMQEEMEKDKDAAKKVQDFQAAAAADEAEAEFKEFAANTLKYLTLKQASPKDFNQEEFYKWLRRENLVFKRKLLDKVDMEIFHEEVRLFRFLESGAITFVADVDMDPRTKDYVIAYRGAGGGGGGMMGGGGGAAGMLTWIHSKEIGVQNLQTMSGPALISYLKSQNLRLLRMHYLTHARANFMRPPADPGEIALWNLRPFPLPSYDSLMFGMPYGSPSQVHRMVEERVPSVMKNPSDPFDLDKFKKYLKEKAPPTVLQNLDTGVTAVNLTASLRNGADVAACLYEIEWLEIKDRPKQMLGHRSITVDGNILYQLPLQVAPWLPPFVPKKDNMQGMMPMPK